MRFAVISSLFLVASIVGAVQTIIPKTCFDSQADFDTDIGYNYPWGTDHNGGARMDKAHVDISAGVLTLIAEPATGQKPASSGGKSIPIHYLSGTVYAKEHFNVS